MSNDQIALQGLDEVADRVASGDLDASELVDASFEQINKFSASHNVLTRPLEEQARQRAAELDAERDRGVIRGPLHGVPVIVKDLINVAGYPRTNGTGHLRDAPPATDNAPCVQALMADGAIVVGLANLHEWAYGGTSTNPHFGAVENAWGEKRIPGGSSGGSAVAVSTGMAFAALGTDTGGSVRIPASVTGTSALKVTVGAVSTDGVHPLSWSLDSVGPMARTVRDLQRPYASLRRTGHSAGTAPVRRHRRLEGTRLGIDRDYYLEEGRVEPGVYAGFNDALEQLEEAGVEIVDVSLPSLKKASPAQYALVLAEASAVHSGPLLANRPNYGEDVQGYLALGDSLPAGDYIAALRYRQIVWHEFRAAFEEVDFMVSPGTPHVACPIGTDEFTWPDGSVESLLDACWRFTFPSNLAGIPSLSQPCGLTPEGLPVGFQLIGEPHSERALLDLGIMIEDKLGWFFTPESVSA